jgi:hypothetical protein
MMLGEPAESHRCLYCGAHVPVNFRRVYGDDDDRAHRCSDCDTYSRLARGSAAGRDPPHDPETNPGRHGSDPA